jgi:uncharacterized repeat protein (TIGR04138 family)
MKKTLEEIAAEDGRFSFGVIKFVYEGLGYTVRNLCAEYDHISGQTLCHGLKQRAIENWGRLAKLVLNQSGVHSTNDYGQIVYLMIKHKWMRAQPSDSPEDFYDVYDFDTVFKDQFEF